MNEKILKVAMVTGASRGIGRAIARELAAQGCGVVVNYAHHGAAAEATAAEINGGGGNALAVQADVGRPEEVDRLFVAAQERFGRLDILVNNAGVSGTATLEDLAEADIANTLNVNVKGTMFATQRAVKSFGAAGGTIINISSALAQQPVASQALYAASKAAVEAFTRVCAQELGGRGIRVNAVAPGPTDTDLLPLDDNIRAYLAQKATLGRLGRPEDIARVVAFLASDAAGWITGQVIGTDGGLQL